MTDVARPSPEERQRKLKRIRIVTLNKYDPEGPPGELVMFLCTAFAEDVLRDMAIGYQHEHVRLISYLSRLSPEAAVHLLDEAALERLRLVQGAPAYVTTFHAGGDLKRAFYYAAVLGADALVYMVAQDAYRSFAVWHRHAGIVGFQGTYDENGDITLSDASDNARDALIQGSRELKRRSSEVARSKVQA